jgi:GWxTD domain-containing protein
MTRRTVCWTLAFVLFLALLSPLPGQKKRSPKDLPPYYRTWLEQEVVYIITPKERDVFLQLESDREREIFIEAFWKQRDPDTLTPENEFRVEHYKRIAYANQYLGREGPGAGWRSDMGRFHILLGAPREISRLESGSLMYPVVTWFYDGMAKLGIPNSFYLMFFKPSGIGEYRLYSPVQDGPASLLPHYSEDRADILAAYDQLRRIDPTIADLSLSFLPDESGGRIVSPSIASEILVTSKIPRIPIETVKDTYAEKMLAYKDIIEVDYTANYIDSYSYAAVIFERSGIAFVHYLLEPSNLTFVQVGDRFRAHLEVNGKVTDAAGATVYQYDRSVPIDFSREQLEAVRTKLFSFQDILPLVEGDYKLDVLLKNTMSKQFTSFEKKIAVPRVAAPRLSPLVLANRAVKDSAYQGQNKPFLVANTQIVPSPRNDFSAGDNLYVYLQALGLTRDLAESGSLEFAILREDEKASSVTVPLAEYPDKTAILREFPLADLPSAYYRIRAALLDGSGNEIHAEQANFFISHLPALPRPWVLSIPLPPTNSPMIANILGNQFFNLKNGARARTLLAEAHRKDPASGRYALDYCRLLLAEKDYPLVKAVAGSFLETGQRVEFLHFLGQAHQALGELAEAIAYYKEYLAHYGTNINVLNAIGDCYARLGNREEARVAWEKSLEISPGQPDIRKKLDALKEKK